MDETSRFREGSSWLPGVLMRPAGLQLHLFCRYLCDLRAVGDPAWQCIGAQHRWLLQLMHGCREGCAQDLKGKAGRRHREGCGSAAVVTSVGVGGCFCFCFVPISITPE